MWRCMHIECLSVATSQPLPPRLCFSSPTVPASSLVPRKFSSVFFSGLRPPFSVGASPCKLRRHINIHTYFAAGSRNRHGFVWRWLPPRRPARRLFCCGGITLKYLYITFYLYASVRDHFAAAIASTSLSPTVPASVCIYIIYTHTSVTTFAAATVSTLSPTVHASSLAPRNFS